MFERLPETIRVTLGEGWEDFYVLIVPALHTPLPHREFFLVHDKTGTAVFMFGYTVETDEEAAEIAIKNAPLYAPDNLETE